jgi:hypothetical protein
MITQAGQRYVVEQYQHVARLKQARAEIRAMPPERFDRYDNPFEAKLTLRDKSGMFVDRFSLNAWSTIMEELESNDWLEHVSELFGVELVADRWRHYAGVFRYLPGDHLGVHVDAGIHPASGLRKHVTAVLYFGAGAGDLELWQGTHCNEVTSERPLLHEVIDTIRPGLGTVVLFENNDYAWHGTAHNTSDEDRIVLTVSYLSAAIDAFANKRQRAFFVPRPSEEWSVETYALRDLRADAEHFAEAYRGG